MIMKANGFANDRSNTRICAGLDRVVIGQKK